MIAAAFKSSGEKLYYYKETNFAVRDDGGKVITPARYTEVNLWAVCDQNTGELLYDTADGEKVPRDFKAELTCKTDNKSDFQFVSGLSKGEEDTTFFWRGDKKEKKSPTRYAATREKFIASDLFAPYSLAAKVAELAELRPAELDFSGGKAKIKRSGELLALTFTVRQEYFERIGEKESLFRDSTRVEVELTYGRVQKLSVYRPAGGWLKEEEAYTNQIVYYGPKIDVPDFSSGEWKDIGPTNDLPDRI